MLRVGLTGGLAAGKSSVATLLAQLGAAVKDADAIVEALYAPGGDAVKSIVRLVGEGVLDPLGGVDRSHLAAMVAGNPTLLRALDEVVHPLVRREIQRWWADLAAQETCLVAVVEAALLVETGSFQGYDRLVVVTAPEELRRARALAAGFSPQLVERLLKKQARDEEKVQHAHYLLDNSGSLATLRAKVTELWQALVKDAEAKAQGKLLPLHPALSF